MSKEVTKDFGTQALFAGKSIYSTIHVPEEKTYVATIRDKKKKVEEIKEDSISIQHNPTTDETIIAESSANPPSSNQNEVVYKVWFWFTKAIEPEDLENIQIIKMQIDKYFINQLKYLPLWRSYFSQSSLSIGQGLTLLSGYDLKV